MITEKTHTILSCVIGFDVQMANEKDIHKKASSALFEIKQENDKNDTMMFSFFLKDVSKQKWKSKDHFTKIFNEEIEVSKERYDMKRHEVLFLYSLSPYLLWELNLLVDENNEPMNQGMLAEKLGLNRTTIKRNMDNLEKKLCVYSIFYKKEKYYLVNPSLMYAGANINIVLPSIFDKLGYTNSRTNRRGIVEKANEIKG